MLFFSSLSIKLFTISSDLFFFCKKDIIWCIIFGITLRWEFWGVFLTFLEIVLFGLNYSSSSHTLVHLRDFFKGKNSFYMLVWDSKFLWLEFNSKQGSLVSKLQHRILVLLNPHNLLLSSGSSWHGATKNQA